MSAENAIRAREQAKRPKPVAKPVEKRQKPERVAPVVDEIAAVELPEVVE